MGRKPTSLKAIEAQYKRALAKAQAENKRLGNKVLLAQQLSPLARARRRVKILRATGGISGISTLAQERFELKARHFLGKEGHRLARGIRHNIGLSPSPSVFLNMLSANKSMSKESKQRAFKSYVRKHGRRSSTID
jgi:hypothetical protein